MYRKGDSSLWSTCADLGVASEVVQYPGHERWILHVFFLFRPNQGRHGGVKRIGEIKKHNVFTVLPGVSRWVQEQWTVTVITYHLHLFYLQWHPENVCCKKVYWPFYHLWKYESPFRDLFCVWWFSTNLFKFLFLFHMNIVCVCQRNTSMNK